MSESIADQLAALLLGELDAETAAALRQRLAESPEGRAALAEGERIAAFLREEPGCEPPRAAVERVKRALARSRPGALGRFAEGVRAFVASLDFDSRLSPALAGFRGVAEVAQVAFSAEVCELDLELTPGESGATRVRGQIAADDASGWVVSFEAEGQSPVRAEASSDGSFRVELSASSYEVVLERPGVRVEAGPLVLP